MTTEPTRADGAEIIDGQGILKAAWWGTGLFLATSVPALAVHAFLVPAFIVHMGAFLVGCVVFFMAYATAVNRSRTDEIGIGGLFFLAGKATAPVAVKRSLLGAFAVQVVGAFAIASAHVYSTLAFATLVPVYGLALTGLWGARHGSFGPRVVESPRRGRAVGKNAPHG